MQVVPEMRRAHSIGYLRFYLYIFTFMYTTCCFNRDYLQLKQLVLVLLFRSEFLYVFFYLSNYTNNRRLL